MENESFILFHCIQKGINVATFPYYRCMQFLHITVSATAVVLMLWVLTKYRDKLIFHYNIKVLLFSLYSASLLHAISIVVSQCYELFRGYTYKDPCDVIVPNVFYACCHISIVVSIVWIENTQILMFVERSIAIFNVSKYEKFSRKIGNCLLFLSVLMTVCQCTWAYSRGQYDVPHTTCLETPPNLASEIKWLTTFLIVLHLVGLLSLTVIYLMHLRSFRLAHTLSVRFQFAENVTSSRLLITLSAMQLIIFLAYTLSKAYLQGTTRQYPSALPMFKSNMLAVYLISEYTLLLPLVTMLLLRRAKHARRSDIQSMIQVKSSGAEGWANYSNQLAKQWNN